MPTILVSIAAVALFWGGWPLVARSAGETGLPGALVMSIAQMAAIVLAMLATERSLPPASALGALAVAGAMMGMGLIAFNAAASSPLVEASTIIPILDTSMIIVAVIGGILFFGEALTVRKLIGIALLLSGILALRPHS
jgi:drug/metabolite transporter (DMT)-like permease